jgi:hypothetical protein
MFVLGMYSSAFFTNDASEVVQAGVAALAPRTLEARNARTGP